MFRLYGNILQVLKFKIDYTISQTIETVNTIVCPDNPDCVQNEIVSQTITKNMSDYAVTETEANAIAKKFNGSISKLDTQNYDWLDGLTFNSIDDALKAFEMGEQAYNDMVNAQKQTSIEQLRADLDFLSIMTGVEL